MKSISVKGNFTIVGPKAVVSDNKGNDANAGNPQQDLKDKGVIDSGCSRHMTGNRSYLTDYEEIDGGFVTFGGSTKGGKITRKVKSVQKNNVLFTDTECVVLSPDFKLLDESHILLKVPRKDNMYSVDLKNVVHQGSLNCLFAKAIIDESNLWHRRLGNINFKTINTLESNIKLLVRPRLCPVTILNTLGHLGTKACDDAGKARVEIVPGKDYILLPLWTQDLPFSSSPKNSLDVGFKPSREEEKKDAEVPGNESGNPPEGKDSEVPSTKGPRINQEKEASVNRTNNINIVSPTVNAASIEDNDVDENIVYGCADDPNIPDLEEIGRFSDAEDDGAEADMTNLDTHIPVSPIPTTRIHKDHPVEQIIGDIHSAPQTRRMTKSVIEHAMFSSVQQRTNHKDFQNFLFACFLSQAEPKKVIQALKDPSWIEAMQDELLQFKNKKDERGNMIKNKARLVAQGCTQEEEINYDEIDVKSAFLYGKIEEEVYVCQPPRFEGPDFPDRVYKVEKALYGLHQAPRAWDKGDILLVQVYVDDIIFGSTKKSVCTEFEKMMHKKFQMSSMGELTFFLGLDVKTASTPMETHKPLLKDADSEDVDEHLFQVNPKVSHLHAVKRIFRYLKGQPKLGFGCRLISWQCKKQTVVANSTTEAKYIAASNCCGQVLWIQNQMLDYGYNFLYTKIYIDNKITICIVKNPVFHSKTKHIEIMHHFIRDFNEKKLIQMIKIQIDQNVVDLLTKAFNRIIHKGWLKWNVTAAKDGIGVNTRNSRVNVVGHYLVLLGITYRLLNANPIRYALTLSPTIYVSCIEQFWSTAKTKTVNNETQIHAKVEGKTIVISELSVRRHLQFYDEDGSGPRCQDTILGDAEAQTRFETASKPSNDRPLSRVNTLRSGEDKLKLKELMELYMDEVFKDVEGDAKQCTSAGVSVSTVEPITTASVNITAAEPTTPPTTATTVFEDEDLTIAQTLVRIRSAKSKVRGVIMKEPSETATRPTVQPQQHDLKDKGKAQMQAELEEEERLAREREEDANIAEWDNTQAMMDADYELATRIQAQEQEELTIEERSELFVELMDKRKKNFARLRAEQQRRKLLTKA
ncbi:putative ribonuclease H-like domain-containing protein [Tanacetum coccineum]